MREKFVLFLCLWISVLATACSCQAPSPGDIVDADPGGADAGTVTPTAHPFLVLSDFDQAAASPAFPAFKRYVDSGLAGNLDGDYVCTDGVILAHILRANATDREMYLRRSIACVDAWVMQAEMAISAGQVPPLAGDDYLFFGGYMEELAFVYDHAYALLTSAQRARWETLAKQAVYNVWHCQTAKWGNKSFPWNCWGTDDPGNNYFFYHLRGTGYWALASQDADLIAFVKDTLFPMLENYYQDPGGGSREGTGYGVAQNRLFEFYSIWKASRAGADLDGLLPHIADSIEYLVHSTMPGFQEYAPYGDLSRESWPLVHQYQLNLVRWAMHKSQDLLAAQHGQWWLQHAPITASGINLRAALLPSDGIDAVTPTELSHHSEFTGEFFVRSSWNDPQACWVGFKAGRYDQTHAHQDQGAFMLFCQGEFLAVTPNIVSHSGLQGAHYAPYENPDDNALRFVKPSGATILQSWFTGLSSSMTSSAGTDGSVTLKAELKNAYHDAATLVSDWRRQLVFNPQDKGNTVRISDACQVASGVGAVFQLHVLTQPVAQADGSIKAGNLVVRPAAGLTSQFVDMRTVDADFNSGWRIDLRNPIGCAFDVTLGH